MFGNFCNALLVLYGLDKPSFTAKLRKKITLKSLLSNSKVKCNWVCSDQLQRTYVSIDFLKAGGFSSQYKIEGGVKFGR